MSARAEVLELVLAAHVYVPSGLRGVSRCACGVPFHGMPHDHRAHVAAEIAKHDADVLRAAADDIEDACTHSTAPCFCGSTDRLRERADFIAVGAA